MNTNHRTTHIVSTLLACAVVTFCFPVSAWAEEPESENPAHQMSEYEIDAEARSIIERERVPAIQLRRLEALEKKANGVFSWWLHNNLRALHHTQKRSNEMYRHIDIILRNKFMDAYTINAISGWNIENNPRESLRALEREQRSARDYPAIQAALLTIIGDLHLANNNANRARSHYEEVLKIEDEDLEEYRDQATEKLAEL